MDLSDQITIGKITFDRDRFLLPGGREVTLDQIAEMHVEKGLFLVSTFVIRRTDGTKESATFPPKYNAEMQSLITAVMSKVYEQQDRKA